MKTRTVFAFAMACVLLMISRSAAEAQESYATLLGKISDQTGAGVAVFGAHRPPLDDQDAARRMRYGIRLRHCLFHSSSRSSRMRLTFEMGGT